MASQCSQPFGPLAAVGCLAEPVLNRGRPLQMTFLNQELRHRSIVRLSTWSYRYGMFHGREKVYGLIP